MGQGPQSIYCLTKWKLVSTSQRYPNFNECGGCKVSKPPGPAKTATLERSHVNEFVHSCAQISHSAGGQGFQVISD